MTVINRILPEFGVADFPQQADIYCRYDEALDTLTHTAIRRASQALCQHSANRAETEQAIIRSLKPGEVKDLETLDQHVNEGPVDLRLI